MSLTRSEAVLELGRRLVAQLDASDDLLASWMTHYVAQLMEEAEKAPAEARGAAQEACAKAILELWQHRNALPSHLRPFEELEPVARTLATLDVDQTDHRYYPQALREAATANADEDTKQWLDLAIGLDYTARILIQFALRSAAHRADSEAEPWVELARQAGAVEGTEGLIVNFVRGRDDTTESNDNNQAAALRDKISRLENFASLAAGLVEDIQAQLGSDDAKEE